MTPRERTVTSGFLSISGPARGGVVLEEVESPTLYGQLFEQYRVPTHRLYTMSLRPSALWTVAATADDLAGGVLAVLAHHRLVVDPGVVEARPS